MICKEGMKNPLHSERMKRWWKNLENLEKIKLRNKRISDATIKRIKDGKHKTSFKKGESPWNKNKKCKPQSEYSNKKRSESMKKVYKQNSELKEKRSKVFKKLWTSQEYRTKMTKILKEQTKKQFRYGMPKETKLKLREAQIKNIENQVFNGLPMMPCVGKYELNILNNLEKCLTYTILRQHRVAGYFLDGYCLALNLAIEIDEKFHKNKTKILKDKLREQEIKQKLNCQFLRIPVEV